MSDDRGLSDAPGNAQHGPRPGGGSDAPILMVLLGLVVSGVVALWALASDTFDPVGDAYGWGRETLRLARDWPGERRIDGHIDWQAASLQFRDADPEAGRLAMYHYGCSSCHVIQGVSNANGSVGPNLTSLSERAYIAGILPNRPGDLMEWLMHPTRVAPDTVMPDLGIDEETARDMAAYLLGGRG